MSDNREKQVVENTRRSTSSIHDLTGAAYGGQKGAKKENFRADEGLSLWKSILIVIGTIAVGSLGLPLILFGIQKLTGN